MCSQASYRTAQLLFIIQRRPKVKHKVFTPWVIMLHYIEILIPMQAYTGFRKFYFSQGKLFCGWHKNVYKFHDK